MRDVFVSYHRHDRGRAEQLVRALRADGVSVSWDQDVPPGVTHDSAVEGAIGASKCVVVLWSSSSVVSPQVRNQASAGADRGVLVPALIEDVSIPLMFRRFQTRDLTDWDGDPNAAVLQRLTADVAAMVDGARRPPADARPASERETSDGEATVGRRRRLAAVWFADVAGFTSLSSKDEDRALAVVDGLQSMANEAVRTHGGRVVKFVGDAALTVFESVDAALRSALDLQDSFRSSEATEGVGLRIGVHLGEISEAPDGDIHGDGVNTASRVEGAARPGQVVVTDAVYREVRNRPHFELSRLGTRELKGLADPIRIFLLSRPGEGLGPELEERYRILGEIGRGGMATVYLANDLKHDRRVAVKVLQPELAHAVGADRFLREIDIVARLVHPQILPLHDSGRAGSHVYYVMPFVEGGSLRGLIDAQAPLPLDRSLRIAWEVADALQSAHAEGIVHRDVKPENILLLKGQALLADFGVAGALDPAGDPQLTASGVVVGSPAYMSPEQVAGDPVDSRADIYALGCVLFEMLTGEKPFLGSSTRATALAHLSRPAPTIASRGVEVPAEVEAVVARALAKEPRERWESATALYTTLMDLRRRLGPTGQAAGRVERPTPNVGVLVSRMCNRWRQVNAFDAALRVGWAESPGAPQIYVVHGDEGSGHGSLVERLVHTRVADFAASLAPGEAGRVVRADVPWPRGQDALVSRRDLSISLFRELAPYYMGDDVSAARLDALPGLQLAPVVVIEHDLWSRNWTSVTPETLRWYAEEFLGSLTDRSQRLWLVFVKVIHQRAPRGWVGRWVAGRRRRAMTRALEAATSAVRCGSLLTPLDELGPVTVEDVKDWFARNRIYESEARRTRLAESMFAGVTHRSIASVEAALAEIHQQFLAEQAT